MFVLPLRLDSIREHNLFLEQVFFRNFAFLIWRAGHDLNNGTSDFYAT